MKNSIILDEILEYAASLGESGTPMTEEKYVVAIIDVLSGEATLKRGYPSSGVQKQMDALNVDLPGLRRELIDYIKKPNSLSFLDDFYMQKAMKAAEEKAKGTKTGEVTPELVLECVLNAPSGNLEKNLVAFKKAGAPSAKATSEAPAEPARKPAETPAAEEDPLAAMTFDLEKILAELGLDTDEQEGEAEAAAPEAEPEAEPTPKDRIAALTAKTKEIHAALSHSVFGQDNAISVFTAGYFRSELLAMTDKTRVRPTTYLFAGPPGVGKTFLAENIARVLDLPYQRFDMSEYCDKEAAIEFCGSDKVYKDSSSGNFTSFLKDNPKSVILLDEIEKAHINIIHLFLQILDAGRIRDNKTDEELSLKDTILIFTTNAGKQLYEDSENGDFSTVSRKVILKALQKDVNPATGAPYFPAAICSRFASGNVVMFNHIPAHNLRAIARKEVLRHADNFARDIGIRVDFDERVFTALLLAEGGAADARTVRSRAESFFDDELFELFRLTDKDRIAGMERICVEVELPTDNPEVTSLFESHEKPELLVFATEETVARCSMDGAVALNAVHSIGEAVECLRRKDIKVVLIDLLCGARGVNTSYLNIEDVASDARDFFKYVREMHVDIPVYLLGTEAHVYGDEEKVSFLRQGARDVLPLTEAFGDELSAICRNLHQQDSMNTLAKANKLITFETAQTLSEDGKVAHIKLFDFNLGVAMDAEDSANVLSNVSKPNVRFDQVIGADEAKKELQYFVEYLKDPKKYMGTGVSAPKGVLLYGPPGTGKTMLAKAMASESNVTFITAEGNQFLKRYVGEGPEKVHELFRTARKYAPSILFIDEIDAIAKERKGADGGDGVGEAVLTAFLTEMDGFKRDVTKPVFVLAATNFDVEPGRAKSLDPALMRRFDRRVYIDLPDRDDRIRYIRMRLAQNAAFAISEEKIDNLATRSTGMSLAELESIFEMALRAVIREGTVKVTDEILEEAFETFNNGEVKAWDADQLERVARHESGHAFLCWDGGETPSYVTVVARGDHGGYMQFEANEGKAIYTRGELLARIRTALGGRAAELVYYGPEDGVSTGASGDLQSATSTAMSMVCSYGMDDAFGLSAFDPRTVMGGESFGALQKAVNDILRREMATAVRRIDENRAAIDALVKVLLTKNHLTGTEVDAIFREHAVK